MIGRANRTLGLITLCCIAGAGCGRQPERTITAGPAPTSASPPAPAVPVAPAGSATHSIDETAVAPETPPVLPPALAAKVAVSAAEPAVVAAAEPVVVAPAAPIAQVFETPSVIPPSVASPAETLDFTSLVTRLRKTKAMNLRTKVAVKNESNDLLERFRAYHAQHGTTTLADLRRSYDLLFHELNSLLQDADPPLAHDIDRSRAAIWNVLADPRKFSTSISMAGA